VLVLDIAMPGGGGWEVLKQLQTLKPGLRVLMLSMYAESQHAVRALKAGASGYLTKDSAPSQLTAAIRQIAAGGTFVTQSLAEKLAVDLRGGPHKEPLEGLSIREYQVLCLLASGKTVTQIANELSLSVKTISTYRVRLQEKLGLDNTAQLMRYAIDRGIAD
jgi:DNA-binding NarL/FixJ family response regulator